MNMNWRPVLYPLGSLLMCGQWGDAVIIRRNSQSSPRPGTSRDGFCFFSHLSSVTTDGLQDLIPNTISPISRVRFFAGYHRQSQCSSISLKARHIGSSRLMVNLYLIRRQQLKFSGLWSRPWTLMSPCAGSVKPSVAPPSQLINQNRKPTSSCEPLHQPRRDQCFLHGFPHQFIRRLSLSRLLHSLSSSLQMADQLSTATAGDQYGGLSRFELELEVRSLPNPGIAQYDMLRVNIADGALVRPVPS